MVGDLRVRDSEWSIASGELDMLLHAHRDRPATELKAAIVEWHLNAVDTKVTNTWVPGMAVRQDAVVEEALGRFHSHHVKVTITRLARENSDLKNRLMEVLECLRFYAFGDSDGGVRAKMTIKFPPDCPQNLSGRNDRAAPSLVRRAT